MNSNHSNVSNGFASVRATAFKISRKSARKSSEKVGAWEIFRTSDFPLFHHATLYESMEKLFPAYCLQYLVVFPFPKFQMLLPCCIGNKCLQFLAFCDIFKINMFPGKSTKFKVNILRDIKRYQHIRFSRRREKYAELVYSGHIVTFIKI